MVVIPRVSHRSDNEYYTVDGQHTVAAQKKKLGGASEILCQVFENLSLQEEAEMFYLQDRGGAPVSAQDKFKARICAKEPVALEMTRLVHGVGLTISPYKGIGAVAALETVHVVYRSLQKTLLVLKDWGSVNAGADVYCPILLKSVGAFFHQYPNARIDRVKEVMRKANPDAYLASIRHEQRTSGDNKEFSHVIGGQMLRNWYNKQLKNGTKLVSWNRKPEED